MNNFVIRPSMSSAIKFSIYQFLLGIKDAIIGILLIYDLDRKIEQQRAEEKRKRERDIAATQLHMSRGRSSLYLPQGKPIDSDEARMIHRVFMSAALSSFIWISIWSFNFVIPALQRPLKWVCRESTCESIWHYSEKILHFFFTIIWLLPLYIISKIATSMWCGDVAESLFKLLYGKPKPFPSVSAVATDLIYGVIVEVVFLFQAYAFRHFPIQIVGDMLYCLHICLLYALYAFEYKWFNMGMDLKLRLRLVEENWPYFCGFGLPLFIMTHAVFSYYPTVVSACIFSIMFPCFIVSGTRASVKTSSVSLKLRIFEPSLTICNYLFSFTLRNKQSRNPIR